MKFLAEFLIFFLQYLITLSKKGTIARGFLSVKAIAPIFYSPINTTSSEYEFMSNLS